jgi:hypothetical protein
MNESRIVAIYRIETPLPVEKAVEALAGEQSTRISKGVKVSE